MRKKVLILGGGLVLVVIGLVSVWLLSKPLSPKIPDSDEISMVQMNGLKAEAGQWGEEFVNDLVTQVKNAKPVRRLDAFGIKNDEDYFVVALTDQNDKRTCLHFFLYDDTLYMSVDHKNVYTDVAFMYDMVDGWTPEGYGWQGFPWVTAAADMADMVADGETTADGITYAVETDYDVRSWLHNYTTAYISTGISEEEALEAAAAYILTQYKLYQYALEHDYDIPDDVYRQKIQEETKTVHEREDYEKINDLYREAGTTFDDYVEGHSAYAWRITDTGDYMKYQIRRQFLEGEDTVDGTSYSSADEYCNAYILNIQNQIDETDTTKFEKELEEGKEILKETVF